MGARVHIVMGRWLASVVRGHMAYYAVPGNTQAVAAFRDQVTRHWLKAMRRRSQKGRRLTWARMNRLQKRWLPPVRVMHPFPEQRLPARAVPTATTSSVVSQKSTAWWAVSSRLQCGAILVSLGSSPFIAIAFDLPSI